MAVLDLVKMTAMCGHKAWSSELHPAFSHAG